MTDVLGPADDDDAATPLPRLAVRLHKLDDVAALCDVTRRYVEQLIERGDLRTVKLGRLVRVRDDDLAAYIDARTTTAGAA